MRRAPAGTASVVLNVLGVAALGACTNVATSSLPASWRPISWIAWLAGGVAVVLIIVVEVRRNRSLNNEGHHDQALGIAPKIRAALLDRVHLYWVEGVLERSLYQEARIELGLTTTVQSAFPWSMAAARPHGDPRSVLPDTPMRTVFADLDQAMLIVGSSGAGKTTMLLVLLREMLVHARDDPEQALPLVLNLSSWVELKEPLEEWIVREASRHYHISPRYVHSWLAADRLALLLDGLDEVAEEHRKSCVEAINTFRREHGIAPLVVCCRTEEFKQLDTQLHTYGTLTIKPLTRKQVRDFLDRAGDAVADARVALAADPSLWKLVDSPLMLSIFLLAYRHPAIDAAAVTSAAHYQRDHLFATYVQAMLNQRRRPRRHQIQTVRCMTFLAKRLINEKHTLFNHNMITPGWAAPYSRWTGPPYAAAAICTIILMLALAGTGSLIYGWRGAAAGAVMGLAFGITIEPIDSWLAGLFGQMTATNELPRGVRYSGGYLFSPLGLVVTFVASLAVGALLGPQPSPLLNIIHELNSSIGQQSRAQSRFQFELQSDWLLLLGYGGGCAITLLAAAFLASRVGRWRRDLTELLRVHSNSELPSPLILSILRSGVRAAPLVGLLVAVPSVFLVAWPATASDGLRFGFLSAGGAALVTLICQGVHAALEQAAVRYRLARADLLPLPSQPILDYACQCLFLRKVGNDYIFVHRLLLDYFATLPTDGYSSEAELDTLASSSGS